MDINHNLKILSEYGFTLSSQDLLENSKKKVIVGMSGGVDSSVSALICKLLGYETIGIFMKNWDDGDKDGHCSAEKDYQDVQKVCEQLNIPYYTLNLIEEYKEQVFNSFLEEFKQGHTPNPDILCNREIKFKVFFEKARALGADFLATGHYCQIEKKENDYFLKKGKDSNKDQSYFLYAIKSQVPQHVIFPIGHLEKPMVRKLAQIFNLATSTKKDSTGIFIICSLRVWPVLSMEEIMDR